MVQSEENIEYSIWDLTFMSWLERSFPILYNKRTMKNQRKVADSTVTITKITIKTKIIHPGGSLGELLPKVLICAGSLYEVQGKKSQKKIHWEIINISKSPVLQNGDWKIEGRYSFPAILLQTFLERVRVKDNYEK